MPLAFLRDKPDSFYESKEYKDFVTLFNSIKPPVDQSPSNDDSESLPIDFLKNVILLRWQGIEYDSQIVSDDDKLKKLICILSSRSLNKIETSPRVFINRSSIELNNSRSFTIKEFISNSLINEINNKRKKVIVNNDDIINKLPPSNSGDSVKDVAKKSAFYKSIYNSAVYDDKLYRRLVTSSYAISGLISLSMSPVDIIEESFASYSYTFKDIEGDIHELKEKILNRFDIVNIHTFSYNAPKLDEKDIIAKTIGRHYNNIQNTVRLGAFYYIQIASVKVIHIPKFNDSTKFRFRFFDRNGEVKNILSSYNVDSNGITIKLKSSFNGYVGLIFDRLDNDLIESFNLYNYFKNTQNIIVPLGQILSGESVKVYVPALQSLPFDYILYDQFQNKTIEPDKVVFNKDYVEFFADFNDNRYILYLLDFRKILSGSSISKVFPNDVNQLLSMDLLSREFEVW